MSDSRPINVVLVGLGKIARDQHLPTIAACDGIDLVATVSLDKRGAGSDAPFYKTLGEAFECHPEIDAVILSTPPQSRYELAVSSIRAGKHIFLEKPPAVGIAQATSLVRLAQENNVSLFTAWHSQFAAGVKPAQKWLEDKTVISVRISWKEDVRRWHPGQDWIFEPGGMGVFDPAINAFSIATEILPQKFSFDGGVLEFPSNRQSPVAAVLSYTDALGAVIQVELDFLQQGEELWTIDVVTTQSSLRLSRGGAELFIDGKSQILEPMSEYAGLYERFIEVVTAGEQRADIEPLVHVADAFLLSERRIVDAFYW